MVLPLAPKKYSTSSRNADTPKKTTAEVVARVTSAPPISSSTRCGRFSPILIAIKEAAPMPIQVPKACSTKKTALATLILEKASAPTA